MFIGATQSYWIASTDTTDYPSLTTDVEVDVAIVGGGIAGISTAYFLRNSGLKVALIEAERIACSVTGHTTAKISSQHRLIYAQLQQQLGHERAQQYAAANEQAIRTIEENIVEEGIVCDFSPQPAFVYTQNPQLVPRLQAEVRAARSLGIKASYQEQLDLPFPIEAAIRFDGQAQFHPRKYLLALAASFAAQGGLIFEKSRIVEFTSGSRFSLQTAGGPSLRARQLVMATNCPVDGKAMRYSLRMFPSRSYIIAVRTREAFPGGMYLRAEYPGRSLRAQPHAGGSLTLIGGENHKTGQGVDTTQHFHNLMDFAHQHFTVEELVYRWSTQDYKTLDNVPYVGYYSSRSRDKLVATGFGKWGMTNATAAALILRDLILKGTSPWQEVYDPNRKTMRASAGRVVTEGLNLTGAVLKDWVTWRPEDIALEPGQGEVFRLQGRRTGVYRDAAGELHLVDTTCTHLGCQLNWNSAERSWDCPCHGGRFTYDGAVIEGPITRPLRRVTPVVPDGEAPGKPSEKGG